ncbi:MAG: MCE family protein [Planctomycetes bacterium]|nr:MCE family protein [Planctomycetota bacterium]
MNAIRHTILGLFFFTMLVVLGFMTIYLGDVTTSAQRTTLTAYFQNVEGLGAGDPVMVYGVQSGRVTEVAFTPGEPPPEKRLRVTFVVDAPLVLKEDYAIAIGSPSLLGGKQLDLMTGTTGAPLPPERYRELAGGADSNLMRQFAGLLEENRADVRRIVTAVAHLAEDVDSGKRSIGELLLNKQATDDLASGLAAARNLLAKVERGEGSLGQLLQSNELHDQAKGFFANGSQLLADAREKKGPLHAAIYDEELAASLKRGIDGFAATGERLGRGEGALGKLTTGESDATFRNLDQIVRDVSSGKGAIGKLFSDPEMEKQVVQIVERFSGISGDAAALLDAARRGRGVLGLLVADDEARRNVERILDQIGRAIEDAREAAPVSSVASFLFGQL